MNRKVWVTITAALLASLMLGFNAWATARPEAEAAESVAVVATKYNESPMLAALVAKGELPSVDERLPIEPLVKIAPEIGRYGGTASSLSRNSWHEGDLFGWWQQASTLEITPDSQVGPGVAKDYELSADQKTFTLYLREGMKWSDGEPFTADDYVFRYQDLGMNPGMPWGYRNEPIESMTAVDDYTLRLRFSKPYPRIVISMANEDGADWNRIRPKHYLKNWHIDYNPDADKISKEEGFDNWGQALASHGNWNYVVDPDVPTLRPWVLRQESATTRLYERNPFWYCVDTEGNQLPYIDRVQATLADGETYTLKVLSGEVTWAKFPAFEDFTLYKQNEASGDYKVLVLTGLFGGMHTYHINQNHEEPVLAEVLRDLRFRRALSLAIDRDEMNETLYNGMGAPRQVTVNPDVSYYKSEWGEEHPYARHDPDQANRLLDEMGLTERDRDGFRKLSNGKTINLPVVSYGIWIAPEGEELVKEYWGNVGIKSTLRLVEPGFFWDYRGTTEWVIFSERATGTDEFYTDGDAGRIGNPLGENWGATWSQYLQAQRAISSGIKTLDDYEGGVMPGEMPPPIVMELWDNLMTAYSSVFGSKEYREGYEAAFDIFAEQLWVIGTVGLVPDLRVVKNNVGNATEEWFNGPGTAVNRWGQYDWALYFKE